MSDVIEIFKTYNETVLAVKINGVEIDKDNVTIALGNKLTGGQAVIMLGVEDDNVRSYYVDEMPTDDTSLIDALDEFLACKPWYKKDMIIKLKKARRDHGDKTQQAVDRSD